MSAAGALQTAMFEALTGNAELTALIGAVHDGLIARAVLPYVTFGAFESADWSTSTESGEEHRVTIEVWSGENGKREAQAIMAAVKDALHERDLALEGYHLVNLRLMESTVEREAKTRRHKGTMRFRAVTEGV